eukprot:jgi/Chlat1/4589/Chrsp290S04333
MSAATAAAARGSSSVLSAVLSAQVSGRGCRSLRALPRATYARLNKEYHGMAALVSELEETFLLNDLSTCKAVLSNVSRKTCELTNVRHASNREAFVLFGGPELLLRIVRSSFCRRNKIFDEALQVDVMVENLWAVRNDCLAILRELCFTTPFFSESLSSHGDFIVHLFTLMRNKHTFDNAVGLAEEILAVREETFNLSDVAGFAALIRSFSSRQLAFFCRVLALVVFEPEDRSGASDFAMHRSSQSDAEASQPSTSEPSSAPSPFAPPSTSSSSSRTGICRGADANHSVLLQVPELLPRLVKLLRTAPSAQGNHLLSHLPITPEMLPFLVSLRDRDDWEDNMDDGTVTEAAAGSDGTVDVGTTTEQRPVLSLKALTLATHQVEVLFVLCALLGGKCKGQVQDVLAKLGLIPALNKMFDRMDWGVAPPRPPTPHGMHGPGCACNPESALKIQYLRLIHNFCDRDSSNTNNKQLLLSEDERRTRRSLPEAGAPLSPFFVSSDPAIASAQPTPGLMTKILKVLMKEPVDSAYRFWLASCVEAFLRGSSPDHQEFVASSGLIEHLLGEILRSGFKCAAGLQVDFDLLGELLKCNSQMFGVFNDMLEGERFDRFVEVIVTHLIDSNVFLRSVVLSIHNECCAVQHDEVQLQLHGWPAGPSNRHQLAMHQHHDAAPQLLSPTSPTCFSPGGRRPAGRRAANLGKIAEFVESNCVRLLRDLMTAIHIGDVNQENICVLNTALIFLIFAERHGQLALYLHVLRSLDSGGYATGNFRALLEFWQTYYQTRGRDCVSLEFSSTISFSEWLRVVSLLLGPADSPVSLSYLGPTSHHCTYRADLPESPRHAPRCRGSSPQVGLLI